MRTLWEETIFWYILFFVIFGQWPKLFDLLAKFSNMVVKTAFYVSIGTLRRKIVFFQKKMFVLSSFGTLSEIFHPYGKFFLELWLVFLTGLSKLPCICPEEQLYGKFCLERKFFIDFGHWEINLRHLSKLFFSGFSKLQLSKLEEKKNWELYIFLSISEIRRNFFGFSSRKILT